MRRCSTAVLFMNQRKQEAKNRVNLIGQQVHRYYSSVYPEDNGVICGQRGITNSKVSIRWDNGEREEVETYRIRNVGEGASRVGIFFSEVAQ